jgi:F0F1-type ATP synthase membrane subunit a
VNQILLHYSYLQVLDFLTTIAFLANGVQEANPLVRLALNMGSNPIGGLIAVKLLAAMLGVYCWRMGRQRLLSRINIMFAVLVAWNLVALIVGTLGARAGA